MTTSANHPGLRLLTVSAAQDLIGGLWQWDLVMRLGWLEIKRRYRRTVFGPLWGTLNLTVFVIALSLVGSGLLGKSLVDYLPFLAAGMCVWVMTSAIITESCTLFLVNQNLIRQMHLNFSVLAYSLVWRNFVAFLHNIGVFFIAILVLSPHLITWNTLLLFPGLLVVLVNGTWVALLLGMVCLRFRDLQQLVATFVQIAMFITPIFWTPDSLAGMRQLIFVTLNPLYSLIEIVRGPLLGQVPPMSVVVMAGIITILGWGVTYTFFATFRKRIPYWA